MPASTNALGYIVSRLPLGICMVSEKVVGMTAISLAPLSMALHLSSFSGSSAGTCKSGSGQLRRNVTMVLLLTTGMKMDKLEQVLTCRVNEVSRSDQERCAPFDLESCLSRCFIICLADRI